MITTNITALVTAARLVAKITPSLMAPMSSPAPKAMGMLSIFAITAMARPNSSTPRPVLPVRLMPMSGPRRKMPIDDSTAASAHTIVDTRFTGMPSSEARSPFSAEARTAMPMSVNLKNAPMATTAMPTMTTVIRWSPLNVCTPHR